MPERCASAIIRLAAPADATAMLDIYRPIVTNTAITFEYQPPSPQAFAARVAATLERLPWLACEIDGRVVGYAYASPFRHREGYQWSAEVSVYVANDCRRRGVGSALYAALLSGLTELGYRSAFAGVSLPNDASVALHEKMGFRNVGRFPDVGYKLGEWRSVGFWQRRLRGDDDAADSDPPSPPRPVDCLRRSERWHAATLKAGASIQSGDG